MGKATKWFKAILGMKKDKEKDGGGTNTSLTTTAPPNAATVLSRDKRRWSFARSSKDAIPPPPTTHNELARCDDDNDNNTTKDVPRSFLTDYMLDKEMQHQQNKHANAVAAATAAAADAAVAAAQAAVAVVRLTQGSGGRRGGGWQRREQLAAVKIQTVFRGYLARMALRALKSLVKLQAHVRGYLVRKRTTATLRSMQALVRAQAAVRSQRSRRLSLLSNDNIPTRPRRSMNERIDESSKFNSKRLSTSSSSFDPCCNNSYECHDASNNSPKIVEIDTFKPISRSRRYTTTTLNPDHYHHYNHHHHNNYQSSDYNTNTSSIADDTDIPMSSPLPCPVPHRLSIPDRRHLTDEQYYYHHDWASYAGIEDRYHHNRVSSTAHSTPRFSQSFYSGSNRGGGPPTPAKSVCGGDVYFSRGYNNMNNHCGSKCPNYMSNTQSFRAKLRSQSAPRQRVELDVASLGGGYSPGSGMRRKRLSLNEVMASRKSMSGVRMHRPQQQPPPQPHRTSFHETGFVEY